MHTKMLTQSALRQQSENSAPKKRESFEEKDEVSDYETSSDGEEIVAEKL